MTKRTLILLACALAAVIAAAAAFADSPPAGTRIVNQGTIRYTDEEGESRIATTNLVVLTVRQVYDATLAGDRTVYAKAGSDAVASHTLRNLGNGTDLYCFSVANQGGDTGDYTKISVFHDVNDNGLVETGEPLVASLDSTDTGLVTLDAGEEAAIIVLAAVPEGAADGDQYSLAVTVRAQEGTGVCQAGSVRDTGANADGQDGTNQDTAVVTPNAVLQVAKESTYNDNGAGLDDDTITYQVTVKNIGTSQARDVILQDSLPANTTFSAGSIATTGDYVATAGVDDGANGSDGQAPSHDGGVPGNITGEIDILASGAEVTFSYTVDLDNGLPGGTEFENTAQAQGDLDNDNGTVEPAAVSNLVLDVLPRTYGVEIRDTGVGAAAGVNDGGDDDGVEDDDQEVDWVPQGATVIFRHVVENTGNGPDAINITVTRGGFPAGTVFTPYLANGNTLLLDTDNDGRPDTGDLASGATRTIMVRAELPQGVTGVGPYLATVTGISGGDPTVSDTTVEKLGEIRDFAVDLANDPGAAGYNDGGSADADPVAVVATTLSAAPGGTAVFDLYVANEGDEKDDYEISAWGDAAATVPMPSGWTVSFRSLSGGVIASTGRVDPGESFHWKAYVTAPRTSTPGTTPFFFKVESAISGVSDVKQDAMTVTVVEQISMEPNGSGTVRLGSSCEYVHEIRNQGNTPEDVSVTVTDQSHLTHGLLYPTDLSDDQPADWVLSDYLSVGDDVAVFDHGTAGWVLRPLVTDGAAGMAFELDPGDYTRVKVQVFAPTFTAPGTRDVLTLVASVVAGTATVTNHDMTTVVTSRLEIVKAGAKDVDCDGTPDTPFSTATFDAQPGQCVIWRVTVINTADETVCRVTVNDTAPAFTSLFGTPYIADQPAPGTTGSCSVVGTDVTCTVGNPIDISGDPAPEPFCLQGGEEAVIRFSVQVD